MVLITLRGNSIYLAFMFRLWRAYSQPLQFTFECFRWSSECENIYHRQDGNIHPSLSIFSDLKDRFKTFKKHSQPACMELLQNMGTGKMNQISGNNMVCSGQIEGPANIFTKVFPDERYSFWHNNTHTSNLRNESYKHTILAWITLPGLPHG